MKCYRFGLFEFDAGQLTLRRTGALVRLQSQPARVLALLLEHRDRVVSREELRAAIWGDTTYVDFESGLNFCIAQIRSVLQDNASSPIYVRTVPKSGYQFIAPVEAVEEMIPLRKDAAPRHDRRTILAIVLAAFAFLGFVLGYALRPDGKSGSPPPILAVARFDNATGNPDLTRFSDGLTDNLVEQLTTASAGRYSVIGNARILRTPREQLDLNALGKALNAKYVVLGQLLPQGEKTRILAHLIRLPDQTHLWVARVDQEIAGPGTLQGDIAARIAAAFSPRIAADVASGFSSPGLGR